MSLLGLSLLLPIQVTTAFRHEKRRDKKLEELFSPPFFKETFSGHMIFYLKNKNQSRNKPNLLSQLVGLDRYI